MIDQCGSCTIKKEADTRKCEEGDVCNRPKSWYEKQIRKQRDELLTVLNLIMTRFGECEALDDIILTIAEDPSTMTDIIDKARAAIQKAEGNLSSVRGA